MNIRFLKSYMGNALRQYTLRAHKSRLFWIEARKYTKYWKKCQTQSPAVPNLNGLISNAVESFNHAGFYAFGNKLTADLAQSILFKIKKEELDGLAVWDGDGRYQLGDPFIKFDEIKKLFETTLCGFLEGIYGCGFSIYYSVIYKSERTHDAQPQGSQLWHADGGPGTCINLMYCLSETTENNGAMKCLPWAESLAVFDKEWISTQHKKNESNKGLSRLELREITAKYYKQRIESDFSDRVAQPTGGPGLVYAFRNNCIHSGGYTDIGRERYVCLFHIYPSKLKTNFDWYLKYGTNKPGSYPLRPDEIDLKIGLAID